jgi:hypothetical protein
MKLNASAKNLIDKLKKNDVETIAAQERQKRQNESSPKLYITDYFSQKNILKPAVFAFIQLSIESAGKTVSLLGDENCLICFNDAAVLEKTKDILKIKAGIQSVDSFIKTAEDWVMAPMLNKNGDIVKFWKIF